MRILRKIAGVRLVVLPMALLSLSECDYDKLVKQTIGAACIPVFGAPLACAGSPQYSFNDVGSANGLATWLEGLASWNASVGPLIRAAADSKTTEFTIKSISDSKQVALITLTAGGLVMAHIRADANGPKEKRYGIGGLDDSWLDDFYIVVDNFNAPSDDDISKEDQSAAIARWRIFGIRRIGNVLRAEDTGASGKFRVCRHKHEQPETADEAYFISCKNYEAVQKKLETDDVLRRKLQGKSVLALLADAQARLYSANVGGAVDDAKRSTSLQEAFNRYGVMLDSDTAAFFLEIMRDTEFDAAWMTCGTGCCTAENF